MTSKAKRTGRTANIDRGQQAPRSDSRHELNVVATRPSGNRPIATAEREPPEPSLFSIIGPPLRVNGARRRHMPTVASEEAGRAELALVVLARRRDGVTCCVAGHV